MITKDYIKKSKIVEEAMSTKCAKEWSDGNISADQSEQDYIKGSKAAYSEIMTLCARNVMAHDKESVEAQLTYMIAERNAAINILKEICEKYGDTEWNSDLYLADILEKHLHNHLDYNYDRCEKELLSIKAAVRKVWNEYKGGSLPCALSTKEIIEKYFEVSE